MEALSGASGGADGEVPATELLGDVEVFHAPFMSFISHRALAPAACDALADWLKHGVPWNLHRERFFEQYECNLLRVPVPERCAPLLAPEALARLKFRVETIFGVKLADRVKIVAHKLVPGQGIGIHTDAPRDGYETHRVILQLNRDFQDSQGGHLVLLDGPSVDCARRICRPVFNTAVGFAMSSLSYHAVVPVQREERHTIIYSYWRKGA